MLPRWPEETLQRHLKPPLKISTYHQSPGNRLHRIKQSGVASPKREQICESANPKESTESAKPEPKDHHQCRHFQK